MIFKDEPDRAEITLGLVTFWVTALAVAWAAVYLSFWGFLEVVRWISV